MLPSPTVNFTNASDWWKIWEYKVGIQLNGENGGVSFSGGMGENAISVSHGSVSTEFVCGINKIGFTKSFDADFGTRTGGSYYHEYIRTVPTVAIGVLVYYSLGAAIPLLQPLLTGGS